MEIILKSGLRGRRGVVLLWTSLALLFVVIPVVGLAIDVGTVYAIKSRLQTAADGAALAAARGLSRGLDPTTQYNSARTTAERFFAANVDLGWLGMNNPVITVTFPVAPPKTTRVNVDVRVDAPTYFMRLWHPAPITVAGMGESSRRDVNIMMVLDRSGSLNGAGACDDLRVGAVSFAQSFVDGRDRLGLITFGTTYKVDFDLDFDFQSTGGGGDVVTMINNIICIGGTNSAAAYYLGYQRLLAINEPGTLNVILFFTDGQPNTLHMPNLEVKAASTCGNHSDKNGVVTPAGGNIWGIFIFNEINPPPAPNPDWRLIAGSAGCAYAASFSNVPNDIVALTKVGAANEVDAFGNALTGYKPVARDGSGRLTLTGPNVTNAGINALDSAASRVRTQSAANGLSVLSYCIALGGPGAAEDVLMNRVCNTPASPIYDSAKPTGMYVFAANASQLSQAFATIASDILRISK